MAGALEGRRAVVTGASSGIGEATALALAGEGAAVSLGARRKDRLDDLVGRIESDGGVAHAFEADLTDEAAAHALIDGAAEAMGGLDMLINNAGVMLLGPVEGTDTDEWRQMVGINVLGLLYCTHRALPLIREAGGGNIVNISSVAGRTAAMGAGVYNFTKFGVVGFTEALRQEAMHSGIRVTVVEPGFVETELQGHNTNPAVLEAIEKMREQAGEVLTSDDIARSIVYVVSQPPHVNVGEILIRPTKQQR
jgi:clavulanate-9-aldehyde reducatase